MIALPRVLVTGASGFVARHAIRALGDAGYHVRAATREGLTISEHAPETVVLPDLSGPFDAGPITDNVDYVVHLAGVAHANQVLGEDLYRAVNAEAAGRLAVAARRAGVRRFVFISSVRAQTGASAEGIVTEGQTPAPADAYGRSKLEGERLVAEALSGSKTEFTVLRPVLVYGAGVKGNMASLARLAQSPFPLPLSGFRARRSLVSAGSLARAIVHVLKSPDARGGTFLVAEHDALSVADIIAALRAGLDRKPGMISVPERAVRGALGVLGRANDVERLFGELVVSAVALEKTGWRPLVSSRDGLAAWMRDRAATSGA